MTETNAASYAVKTKVNTVLPTDVQQVGIVAKYDILKYLRSRRLLGMLVIEALVLALITALIATSTNPHGDADNVISTYIGFTTILIVIGATLFGGDAIVSDFQGRTGYLLFPNPVKRWAILAGKFVSSVGVMFLVLFIYYAIAFVAGLTFGVGNGPTVHIAESLLLAMLYGVSALAVAFFISSVMKGSTGSLILTFALFLFIFSIAQSLIGSLGGVKPWFILTFAGDTLSYIMQVPYPTDTVQTLGQGAGIKVYTFYPDVATSVVVMIAYIAVALGLTYLFFKRREMAA